MTSLSVNKIVDLINHQLLIHDKLSVHLAKACALSLVGSGEDLSDYSQTALQNYFWTLSDLIKAASDLNQDGQKHLFVEQAWFKTLSMQEVLMVDQPGLS